MKSFPQYGSQFFLFEKAKYFCGKNLSTEEFCHELQRLSSWLSTSLDLHIPPNLELILGKWYLACNRKIEWPGIKLHIKFLTAYEISERVG